MATIFFEQESCEDLVSFFPIASREALLLKMCPSSSYGPLLSNREESIPGIRIAERNSMIHHEIMSSMDLREENTRPNRFSVPKYVKENFLEIKGFHGWELWNTNPISPYPCPYEIEDLLFLDEAVGTLALWMNEAHTLLAM